MQSEGKRITILMADDDADDRLMTKEAFEESRLVNDLRFVEDGVELLDYLKRRGKYEDPATSPRPGLILLDLNMPTEGRARSVEGDQIRSEPEEHPHCHPHDFESGGRYLSHLRSLGGFLYHEAGHLRSHGRSGESARQILAGNCGPPE